MRILVVEDDSHQQEQAKKQLTGHDVVVIDSYCKAFQIKAGFDAVLTDMNLPATDEYPLLGQFKGQEVQAVMRTAALLLSLACLLAGLAVVIYGIALWRQDRPRHTGASPEQRFLQQRPHPFFLGRREPRFLRSLRQLAQLIQSHWFCRFCRRGSAV